MSINNKPLVSLVSLVSFGIRRAYNSKTLEAHFPLIDSVDNEFFSKLDSIVPPIPLGISNLNKELVDKITALMKENKSLAQKEKLYLEEFLKNSKLSNQRDIYSKKEFIILKLDDLDKAIQSVEEAYFKLHLISARKVKPHSINLTGLFKVLPNVAWSNHGPIRPEDLNWVKLKHPNLNLAISHVDKFPYLVNYYIPSGVRIADGSRVRLGAYLGEGTTVMPAGFVNFNAGTLGASMVEGRISAGVVVEKDSDLGGGSSVMGTLSGGNNVVISIGKKCLIGANAGTGISLGFGCTIAAGVYVTAASKVRVYNLEKKPVDLNGKVVVEGENIVKAIQLSGRDKLLFISDSGTGELKCFPNKKTIQLNEELHGHN